MKILFENWRHYLKEEKPLREMFYYDPDVAPPKEPPPSASPRWDAKQQGGIEVFRDDNEWKIYAIHSEDAAIKVGRNTHWDVSVDKNRSRRQYSMGGRNPNTFRDYYSPDDPLFYFEEMKTGVKYMFKYGDSIFVDGSDRPVPQNKVSEMTGLLNDTGAAETYGVINRREDPFGGRQR